MATETIQSRKVVGQYGCLAFHGLGRERVAIPEPPIRKGSGDDLPQPSEEAKRAYQILCLNKLPCLPSRSKAQVQKNEGNRGNGVQHLVNSKEGNVAGTEVLVQGSRRPPLSPPREQPPPSGHARPENIRHASNVVTTDDNAGRPCPVFGNCQDLKARYQEIDQLIILQARSFANVDPKDYDAIARLQHRITELFQSKEKIVPDNSKAIQHGTNLPQHDGAHAAGPFNTELQEGRDNGMQCNNYQGHIPGHLSHEGQTFHSEGILGPINGFEHGISEFGGQERIVNPPWQANRAAMAVVNLEWVDASNDPEWQREDFPWSNEAKRVNREVFGNQSFRYHQLSIINATMKGRDVFVLMPTGGGKSLCYQLPSVLPHGQNRLKKLTVVISPLISLMQDQAFHLEQLGLKAINLGAGASDLWKVSADVEAGELQVMFLTPEKLTKSNYAQSTIRTLAKQDLLARIVIDEAHCVSQWGHDFRPDYTQLSFFKELCPGVPILALTATATPRVQKDIVMQLGLSNCLMFRSSFNRPNLSYEVRCGSYKKDAKVKEIAEFIAQKHSINLGNRRNAKCGIIYCTSKKRTEEVAGKLDLELGTILGRLNAPRVRYYHADLLPEERERIQQSWTDGHLPIVVATVAFGMGINKPDVRFVIHYNMPKSLEGYLQESGRAGRDGEAADCVLYYNWSDVQGHKSLLQDPEQRQEALERGATSQQYDIQQDHSIESLHAIAAFCQEPLRCRREMMLEHFDEKFERSQCNRTCDNCQKLGGHEVTMVDRTDAAKTVIQVVCHLAKKQEATGRNETSLTKIATVFNGASSQEKHDTSIFGAGKVHRLSKKEVDRLIRTMITKGIIKENVQRSIEGYLASSHKVDEAKASLIMTGELQVQLTVPVTSINSRPDSKKKRDAPNVNQGSGLAHRIPEPPKTTNARFDSRQSPPKRHKTGVVGAPSYGHRKPLPLACHNISSLPFASEALPHQMPSAENSRRVQDGWAETRHQVMTVMLRQLCTELKRFWQLPSIPINTKVQAELANNPPTSMESLHALQINNLSKTMKQRYGTAIIAGVTQADNYIRDMKSSNSPCSAADFQLDTSQIIGEMRPTHPSNNRASLVDHASVRGQITSHPLDKDGWSDEDNQETRLVPNFSRFQYNNANQLPPVPLGGITNQMQPLPNCAISTTLNQENQLLKAKLAHGVERALAQRTPPPSVKEASTWEIDVDISGADWP